MSDPASRLRRKETFSDFIIIAVALGLISVGLIAGVILWLFV